MMCRRRRVSGFRAYLPTACNCYDDENDRDEPDLSREPSLDFKRELKQKPKRS